jgi:hypothetical protein
MAMGLAERSKLEIVVDLPVEEEEEGCIFTGHRLIASCGQVVDGEAGAPKGPRSIAPGRVPRAPCIRSSMGEVLEHGGRDPWHIAAADAPDDAAHLENSINIRVCVPRRHTGGRAVLGPCDAGAWRSVTRMAPRFAP